MYRSQPLAIAMKLWYAPTPDVKPYDLIAMRYESYPPIFRHRHRDNSRKKGGGAARRRRGGGGAAAAALPAAAAAAWWWCGCGGAPGVEARAARARTNSEMALAPSVYFSKFATKSAVALSRAKFREICRGRSAVVALDDRLSRGLLFSPKKSLARFARQGHATPTANLSQVTHAVLLECGAPCMHMTCCTCTLTICEIQWQCSQNFGEICRSLRARSAPFSRTWQQNF